MEKRALQVFDECLEVYNGLMSKYLHHASKSIADGGEKAGGGDMSCLEGMWWGERASIVRDCCLLLLLILANIASLPP